jgi:TBC1 domain family member 20
MNEWEEMRPGDVGTSIFEKKPFNNDKREVKEKTIKTAAWLRDFDLLRTLARSRLGLVTDELRREIWPLLLRGSIPGSESPIKGAVEAPNWRTLPPHPEEEQVQLDVDRSFVFYPANLDAEKRMFLQEELRDLILCVLRRNSHLSYYQGYHDVAQVVLLVFGSEEGAEILEMLSLAYLRDFMLPDLNATLQHLKLLPSILSLEDPFLGDLLSRGEPFFALSPILTLFAHHIRSQQDICIIFDFILGSGTASLPLYMLVAMIIDEKENLKKLSPSDHDSQHLLLSNLADNFNGDWFEIAKRASTLQEKFALESLPLWSDISEFSVLKTTKEYEKFNRTNVLDYLDHQVDQVHEEREMRKLEEQQRRQLEESERKKSKSLTIRSVLERDLIRLFTHNNFILPRSVLALTVGVGILAFVGSSVFKYDARLIWHNIQDYLKDKSR